jgi:hypothetical protein
MNPNLLRLPGAALAIITQREPRQLQDYRFMPADEKRKVLNHWEMFLRSGLEKDKFTRALYVEAFFKPK